MCSVHSCISIFLHTHYIYDRCKIKSELYIFTNVYHFYKHIYAYKREENTGKSIQEAADSYICEWEIGSRVAPLHSSDFTLKSSSITFVIKC